MTLSCVPTRGTDALVMGEVCKYLIMSPNSGVKEGISIIGETHCNDKIP